MKAIINKILNKKKKTIEGICDSKHCKACCCYTVPLPQKTTDENKDKIVNPIISIEPIGESDEYNGYNVLAMTDINPVKSKCPFLRKDYLCNIYDVRPNLCRLFGTIQEEGDQYCRFMK